MRCEGCLKPHQGKQVHKILKLRYCKKCYKSRKFELITKTRGMKSYSVKEGGIEGLRKVEAENGEDLYMRADVKALNDARQERLRNAIFGGLMGQLQEQTGGSLRGSAIWKCSFHRSSYAGVEAYFYVLYFIITYEIETMMTSFGIHYHPTTEPNQQRKAPFLPSKRWRVDGRNLRRMSRRTGAIVVRHA